MSLLQGPGIPQAKPIKFEQARPGSVIEVTGPDTFGEGVKATVIEMRPEYGPTSIPALVLATEGRSDPWIVTANGQHQIRILLDSGKLGTKQLPLNAIHARKKPIEIVAVRFIGGNDSAMEIVRWVAGKAAVSYRQEDEFSDEAIIIKTLEGDMECAPGSYMVEGVEGEFYPVAPSIWEKTYDEIETVFPKVG